MSEPIVRRRWLGPGLVFVIALVIRLLVVWQSASSVTFNHPIVDALTFDQQGRALASGTDPFADRAFSQPPGYPYLLAALDLAFGHSYVAPRLLQALFGAATALLLALIAGVFFGRRLGLIAGFICAFEGLLVYFDDRLLAPSLTIFLQVLAMYAALRARRSGSWVVALSSGVALGAACVATATSLILAPVIGWPVRRRWPAFLAGLALAIAPVTWHNLRLGDHFLISTNGGINLYLGNNPDYDQMVGIRPGDRWTKLVELPPRVSGNQREADAAWFRQRALDWIRWHPAAFLRLQLHKLRLFVGGHEVPRNEEIYAARQSSSVLAALLWQIQGLALPWGLLFPLGMLGLVVAGRRAGVIAAAFLIYSVAVLAFFVTARYRAPLVPWLAVLAPAGVQWLLATVGPQRWVAVGGVLGLYGVSNFGQGVMAHELNADAEYEIGNELLAEKDVAGALAHCQTAIRIDPNNADAWQSLGVVLRAAGRLPEAERAMQHQVRLAPDNAEAWANLGSILAEEGRLDEAIPALAWSAGLPPWRSARGRQELQLAVRDALCKPSAEKSCEPMPDTDAHMERLIDLTLHKHGELAAKELADAWRSLLPLLEIKLGSPKQSGQTPPP